MQIGKYYLTYLTRPMDYDLDHINGVIRECVFCRLKTLTVGVKMFQDQIETLVLAINFDLQFSCKNDFLIGTGIQLYFQNFINKISLIFYLQWHFW